MELDILASCNITTLIWMSQKVVCWWAGFSTVPVVFLVRFKIRLACNVANILPSKCYVETFGLKGAHYVLAPYTEITVL